MTFTIGKVVARAEFIVYTCDDLDEAEEAYRLECERSDATSCYEVILRMDGEICKRY